LIQTLYNATVFRLSSRVTPLHVLLVVAALEVVIDRVLVPAFAPAAGIEPSTAHTILAFAGLFLLYFTGTLAVIVALMRASIAVRTGTRLEFAANALLGLATLIAAIPLFISMPKSYGIVLELAFGVAIVALTASAFGRTRDRGVQIGLVFMAIPLVLHVVRAMGSYFVWPDEQFDGPGVRLVQFGVFALAIAALATPYCFAPRPFARAVTKPIPVISAMAIAAFGAVISRLNYPAVAKTASRAIGVDLEQGAADPRLALYLLAIATLAWTLVSTAMALSPARRRIGMGIALVVLGGHGFKWPNHYLLPLVGFALIAEAARLVREEELAAMPVTSTTPPIGDGAWAGYMSAVATGLKRTFAEVHSLTARGDGGMTSSVIVAEMAGMRARVKVERIDGSVLALDIVAGKEIDEHTPATLVLWAVPEKGTGTNPQGPEAEPAIITGDPTFDDRFRVRGSGDALAQLFDPALRARSANALTGWLAYWHGEGVRVRIYPGHGSALDNPMAITDLALGRTGSVERFVSMVELVAEIAKRAEVA